MLRIELRTHEPMHADPTIANHFNAPCQKFSDVSI